MSSSDALSRLRSVSPEIRAQVIARLSPQHKAELVERWRAENPPEPVPLREHIAQVDPGPHLDWWHVGAMIEVCQAVLNGEILRLLVHAPPRTHKSRTVIQDTASCAVRNYPNERVGLGMAADDVLKQQSRWTRDKVLAAGVQLRQDSRNVSLWETPQKGGLWARTVGSRILGVGAHLLMIDDPFGSLAEAKRLLIQMRVWDWATNDFWGRREMRPDGRPPRLIIMHQGLAVGDLRDRVLAKIGAGEDPFGDEPWTVLDLKGRWRERRTPLPSACRVVKDPRKTIGEPLCPALQQPIDERSRSQPELHERVDQGEPPEDEGGGVFLSRFFRVLGIRQEDEILAEVLRQTSKDRRPLELLRIEAMARAGQIATPRRYLRGWDLSAGGVDKTASSLGVELEPGQEIEWIWAHATSARPPILAVESHVMERARLDGPMVEQVIPDEPAMGKPFAASLKAKLETEGFTAHLAPQRGPKRSRAAMHAAATAPHCRDCGGIMASEDEGFAAGDICGCEVPNGPETGRVAVLAGVWVDPWLARHQAFTGDEGGKDDEVDSAAVAWNCGHGGAGRAESGGLDGWM